MSSEDDSTETETPARRLARLAGLFGGLIVAVLLLAFADLDPARPVVTRVAAVAAWMAIWWMTEAMPLAATSLLPLALFPALGIMGGEQTAVQYTNDTIFLFLGGFLIALAMERWNLHERIALRILALAGGSPRGILAGFMAATAFLSMWISNTATAMMMAPIALALVMKLEAEAGRGRAASFASAVLMAIAYAASIGGVATPVGTPPNLAFFRAYSTALPDRAPVSFAQWMLICAPIAAAMLVFMWAWLAWKTRKAVAGVALERRVVRERIAALGPVGREEGVILCVGVATALLWVFRTPIAIGETTIPGWSTKLPDPKMITDGFVAMAMALLLFLIPARKGGHVLDGEVFRKLPWGIVLLFGGGFALAAGIKDSGLSDWMGLQLKGLAGLPPLLLVASICLVISFAGELTSNTATAVVVLPLLAATATAVGIDPVALMIPGTIACSFSFMLPVGTPPNAIVFATDRVPLRDMMSTGFVLNIAGVIVTAVLAHLLVPMVLR